MLGKGILDQLLSFAVLQPCGVEVSLAGQKTEIRFRMIFLNLCIRIPDIFGRS